MAQGTGAKRLLGLFGKTRSAAAVAALLVALLVSGCGGDSDDPETQGTQATERSAQGTTTRESAEKTSKAKAQQAAAKSKGSSGSAQAGGSQPSQAKGKQAPPITIPKGKREPEPTPQQRAEATVASMRLQSPAAIPQPIAESTETLPAPYTCKGKDTSPPLRWSGVPAGTTELVLFIMNLVPVNEELFFNWAVAGIDPSLEELTEGTLPKGAILGQNGHGKRAYSICPKGKAETYIFALYALPTSLNAKPGFDPLTLRKEVLDLSGNVGLMAVGAAG